ncbi:3-hydroxyisobutyrate dehydrogenase/hypothetical protein [Branchiibius hedensis]|uniref:3-hydroxyisobutyrate dehydrogenase n=1 Tax=Branchiibius hedensis TaxID=672460 RepID=A0A2Y8ZUE5_9MICO|nr:DUF1932 domain-containing protein [Branchiibius hedensis]PWJ26833.1 3-hydroxyisobutyrate dehydrogenase/hypothetical protein [Branchiibius hedensis]SSA35644.1 3-hydroxyisobutyrate dehydrogenase [Branchiibius hedensis]
MRAVALIGLGEVGRVFAEELRNEGVGELQVWDTAFVDPASRASRNAADLGLAPAPSAAAAVTGAELVICAVTAANSVPATEAAAPGLAPGSFFVDVNSSSPAHKQESFAAVEAVGGRYVEVALMSPIQPRRLRSPFLPGGPYANEFLEAAAQLGIDHASVASQVVGRAAATKLCRSVVIKGMEALVTESLLAARRYGVERDVLDSFSNLFPKPDWDEFAGYLISRTIEHGQRRSEEMAEAAQTVADAGVAPTMTTSTVMRQAWAADRVDLDDPTDVIRLLDAILTTLGLNDETLRFPEPEHGRPT